MMSYDSFLRSDTLKDFQQINIGFNPKIQKDIEDLSLASKTLKGPVISLLVSLLDDLNMMPIDSESLSATLHSHGINMRYLGHINILS